MGNPVMIIQCFHLFFAVESFGFFFISFEISFLSLSRLQDVGEEEPNDDSNQQDGSHSLFLFLSSSLPPSF
jgi:hypothetical protein